MAQDNLYNMEAERAVLGAMMMDNAQVRKVRRILLLPSFFYATFHTRLYKKILQMTDANVPCDIVTLQSNLAQDTDKQPNDIENLVVINEAVPTASTAVHYANIVKECYIRRSYVSLSDQLANASDDRKHAVLDQLNDLKGMFRDEPDLKSFLEEGLDAMKKRFDGYEMGTGIRLLDGFMNGISRKIFTVIGAETNHGKTALAVQLAWHNINKGKKIHYYTYDLSAQHIFMRTCLFAGGQPTDVLWKSFGITPEMRDDKMAEVRAIGESVAEKHSGNFLLKEFTTLEDMETDMLAKPDIVIVDYLQKSVNWWRSGRDSWGEQDRWERYISRLKEMGNRFNCAIVALSQFHRPPEKKTRQTQRPELSSFKGSGSIEQGAQVCVLLDWPHHRDNTKPMNEIYFRVAKNSFGITSGWTALHFDAPRQRMDMFEDKRQ
jgi:replicative DNA helicase